MDIAARMRSDGRVTIPRAVREALAIEEGDEVVFRVEGQSVTVGRTPNFPDLAGPVDAPPAEQGTSWDEIRQDARRARSERLIAEDAGFWQPEGPDDFIHASGVSPFVFRPPAGGDDDWDADTFLDSIFGDGGAT